MKKEPSSSEIQYHIVASRRQTTDSLMWQVPVLSLTAQAFLFSIALDSQVARAAQLVAAILALITSLGSIQLMIKHRHHETLDSKWLEQFEKRNRPLGFKLVHARRAKPEGRRLWRLVLSIKSYHTWLFVLGVFALGAIGIIFLPSLFTGC